MSCLFLLQRQFFRRDVDKYIGIAMMYSEFGIVSQGIVFRVPLVPSYSYSQIFMAGLLFFLIL